MNTQGMIGISNLDQDGAKGDEKQVEKKGTYRNTSSLRLATHLAPFQGERTNDVLFHNTATTYLGKGGEV